jgi:hypothetical protein
MALAQLKKEMKDSPSLIGKIEHPKKESLLEKLNK